ncbi:MAG TPA: SulP family inorganic anion transporter [Acidimicrobiia bacterium]|nr:SulP family inorganic anion transporter [Acidimicrobiia bacterium]
MPGRTQCPPLRTTFLSDLLASLVVFLVALPLCLGIAIASGVPPALGLVTGIVGGLVVGVLQGSPISVSGPAAGLTVIVAGIVDDGGVVLLSAVGLACGLLQIAAGLAGSGRWFRAVPPALIHGMLAGIGVLIVASQSHVMVDDEPAGHGLENIVRLPAAVLAIFRGDATHTEAAMVGLLTIGTLLAWKRFAPGRLRLFPATLVGVGVATLITNVAGLPIARVEIPGDVFSVTQVLSADALALLGRLDTWSTAFALAVVASAETLLCVGAVDRMAGGAATDYDRELRAQGVGNTLCGLLGALPMTAVIVRSSTNLQAGARSRASTILHGTWLLALVALAPWVLRSVAVSSLAAVLVYTGWKLIDRTALAELRRHGGSELTVYAVTLGAIVVTDLLIGIIIGVIVDWEALRRSRNAEAGGDGDSATGNLAPTGP